MQQRVLYLKIAIDSCISHFVDTLHRLYVTFDGRVERVEETEEKVNLSTPIWREEDEEKMLNTCQNVNGERGNVFWRERQDPLVSSVALLCAVVR